jgi:hypothetical protein
MSLEKYSGRYYLDYETYLENPILRNSEVEELLLFIKEKEVMEDLSDTAKEQARGYFPLDIILQEPRGTSYSKWLSDYTFSKALGDRDEHGRLSQLQSDFIRRFH